MPPKTSLEPDLEDFHKQLVTSLDLHRHGPADVARDFRKLFLEDPYLGKRVLFMILSWCGEYDVADDDGRVLLTHVTDTLQRLDELGAQLGERLRTRRGPEQRIAAVNEFVFKHLAVTPATGRRRDEQLDHLLLHRVLERRTGHCLGLSTLYLALCARNGLPIYGVSAPGHFFCRYDDGTTRINIETTVSVAGLENPEKASSGARMPVSPRDTITSNEVTSILSHWVT